jgi:hypothetical protein
MNLYEMYSKALTNEFNLNKRDQEFLNQFREVN